MENYLKASEVENILNLNGIYPDQVSKSKGNYIVRFGYFYTHGNSSKKYRDKIEKIFENGEFISDGNYFANFKGGASVSKSSHFWVRFNLLDPKIYLENNDYDFCKFQLKKLEIS